MNRGMRRVALGLGGNLGDRVARLREAVAGLRAAGAEPEAVSSLYDTPPWGVEDQPRFANAVVVVRTALSPRALLALAKRLEAAAGRDLGGERWGARPLDVDLLLIDGETVSADVLTVPHARMTERAFVLVPLAEVAPGWDVPGTGRRVADLLGALPAEEIHGVERIAGPAWADGA